MAQPEQGQRQPNNGAQTQAAPPNGHAGARVSVACKLPSGFIIRGMRAVQETENVLGGGVRDVTVYRPSGEEAVIGGVGFRAGSTPPLLVNGYRITPNVPKDLWDNWHDANRTSDLVRNKIVYATERSDAVDGWTREHREAPTGLEGIDPMNPGKRVRGIERADKPK